ncbi:ribonuclease H2 subunit C, putative [Hepatocystis sp. ex Piliocolobus tephrosceles]|nr:ribonuclease H2 subunit C, putative [Hepatocystis sp. ex Piliocolobus tephrosceles]
MMNSFFSDDTTEEDNLIKSIKKSNTNKIPNIIKDIATSNFIKRNSKGYTKNENANIKTEIIDSYGNNNKDSLTINNNSTTDKNNNNDNYSNEEVLSVDLHTNILPFHIKKTGKINADIFFIPYKSEDNKDVITDYTYNYDYYDVYSPNIEKTNKVCHQLKKRTSIQVNEISGENKKIKIEPDISEKNNTIDNNNKSEEIKNFQNFQKLLVHFRGRLFIGVNVEYSFFHTKTYLSIIKDDNKQNEKNANDLSFINKQITTYNHIKNAIYWKQDEYPDLSDNTLQKFNFLLLVPSLVNFKNEEEELKDVDVVF